MRAAVARGGLAAFGTRFGLRADDVSEYDRLERQEGEGRERNGQDALHTSHTSALSEFLAIFITESFEKELSWLDVEPYTFDRRDGLLVGHRVECLQPRLGESFSRRRLRIELVQCVFWIEQQRRGRRRWWVVDHK